MGIGKRFIIRLLVVFISCLSIDGGRSVMFVSNNIQILLCDDHPGDYEIPDTQQQASFGVEDKLLKFFRFDFSCSDDTQILYISTFDPRSQDYSCSIWQPPKFV
jgi:hypothetical protein